MDSTIPIKVMLSHPLTLLGTIDLEQSPYPGEQVEFEGQTYIVLERRNQYQFQVHHYHLHSIALYVQLLPGNTDKHCINGQWVIGDITCRYNARSPLIRCAVHPSGPCSACTHYQI